MDTLNTGVANLQQCYNLKVKPDVSLYLGMNIQRDRKQRTISIGLPKFVDKVLANFDFKPRMYTTSLSSYAFQAWTNKECVHIVFECLL